MREGLNKFPGKPEQDHGSEEGERADHGALERDVRNQTHPQELQADEEVHPNSCCLPVRAAWTRFSGTLSSWPLSHSDPIASCSRPGDAEPHSFVRLAPNPGCLIVPSDSGLRMRHRPAVLRLRATCPGANGSRLAVHRTL